MKNKTLLVIVPLIIFMSFVFALFQIRLQNRSLLKQQLDFDEKTHGIYKHYIDDMVDHHYTYRLKELLLHESVIKALAQQDRKLLHEKARVFWGILKEENPYLSIMHFHRPDGTSLLRMHKPEIYDDNIAGLRKSIQKIHKSHEPLFGCEIGRHGIYYRVILPVFEEKKYIGAVEVGIDVSYITDALYRLTGLKGAVFVSKEDCYALDKPPENNLELGKYILWNSKELENYFRPVIKSYHFQPSHEITADGLSYIAHDFILPGTTNSFHGKLIFLQEITLQKKNMKNFIYKIVLTTFMIIVFITIVLEITLGQLLSKIELINGKLTQKIKEVTLLSITDPLTQIFNRQKLNQVLTTEIQRNNRYKIPFSVLMVDIDHFKDVNDRYGHDMGDRVLIDFCRLISEHIRENDIFARWGGEEFIILLSSQSMEAAGLKAEYLRELIGKYKFKKTGNITASFGVTEYKPLESEAQLFKRLDNNLYLAKKRGRNQVVTA